MEEDDVDVSIDFLCETFKSLDTTEQESVDEAERRINILFKNHLISFMELCAKIIISEAYDEDSFVIGQSIANLKRAFTPIYFSSMDEIRRKWAEEVPEECKQMVRDAAVRGMMFPQENILTNAASLFSYIFTVDLESLNAFEYLLNLLSGEYGEASIKSGLIATREICNPDYADEAVKEVTNSSIIYVFEKVGDLYANITFFPIDIGLEILAAIITMEQNLPALFQTREVIEVLVNNAIELIPICQDPKLYESMFIMLERLVEANYERLDFYEIFDWSILLNAAIQSLSTEQGFDFVINGLMFFNFLLKFEEDIYNTNSKIDAFIRKCRILSVNTTATFRLPQPSIYHGLVNRYCDDLVPVLLTLGSSIGDSDQEAEDVENPDIPMAACSALRHCAFLNESAVTTIVNFWRENLNQESWSVQHLLAIIPYLICHQDRLPRIKDVITNEMFSFVLQTLNVQGQIPRIIDTGLYTLGQLIKKARLFNIDKSDAIVIANCCGALFGVTFTLNDNLDVSIQEVEIETPDPLSYPIIANRVATTLYQLYENLAFRSTIVGKAFFTINTTILRKILEAIPNNDGVIRNVNRSLNGIIHFVPDSLQDEILGHILPSAISSLENIAGRIEQGADEQVDATRLMTTLWIVCSVFQRFRSAGAIAHDTALTLFGLMQCPNMEMYHEEILRTIILCMNALAGTDISDIRENIESYIEFAYETRNPSLVVDTISGMAELIKSNPLSYETSFVEVVDRIMPLLLDESFPVYSKPPLMRRLGEILDAMSKQVDKNLRDQILEAVFQVYSMLTSDASLADDSVYFNDVYIGLFEVFRGALLSTEDNDPILDRVHCKMMINLIKPLAKSLIISAATVNSFLNFLTIAIQKFGRKGNIILNWMQVHAIIIWGMVIADKDSSMGWLKDKCDRMKSQLGKI